MKKTSQKKIMKKVLQKNKMYCKIKEKPSINIILKQKKTIIKYKKRIS
jgi:hypothetical protein